MAISKSEEPQLPSASIAPIPRKLGKYEVIDRLAVGGMAEVFVCSEHGLGGLERLAVVKRILPHLAVHEAFVEMFLAEARFVARLNHPNVVQVIELAQDDQGAPFLAMEYLAGSSIRDVLLAAIGKRQPTPIGAAVGIIVQACAGAHAAHELADSEGRPLGLVHRDISPHNLMVTSDGHTKLLDFGIAKATLAVLFDDQTRTGALKGKVHYMSPEQCKQQALDRRSDVFALGIVLWETLAQERLFRRESELESMQAIINGDRRDLRKFRPEVPHEIIRVLEKALAPAKEDRYDTADDMRKALIDACKQLRIGCSEDDVAAFVKPLLGEAQKKREADLLQQARDKTEAPHSLIAKDDAPTLTPSASSRSRPGRSAPFSEHPGESSHSHSRPRLRPSSKTTPISVDTPRPRGRSRDLLAAVLVLVMFGGTLGAALAMTDRLFFWKTGEPMIVGFPPTADPDLMLEDTEQMRAWLEDSLERPTTISIAKSYDDLQSRLLNGELALAALPPYLYIETKQREPRIEIIATKLVEGSSGNDSIIYVNTSSGVTEVGALRGKRFCFPDHKSTTGYLFPRLAFKRAGLDPEKDIAMHRSGSHMQAMRDLLGGVCDAAATYSGGYLAADRAGIPVALLRQLAIIGRSPHDAMVVHPDTPEAERRRIQNALLSFRPKDGGRKGRVERISGFEAARNLDYDAVREALNAAK